jgi:hypothetical protein
MIVREHLDRMQRMPWSSLVALPELSSEDIVIEGTRCRLSTYVEAPEASRRRIVVDLRTRSEPVLRIFSRCLSWVEGIEIQANGGSRALRDEEMAKYM